MFKAPLNSYQLHFLSSGTSQWAKTDMPRGDFDGKVFKNASFSNFLKFLLVHRRTTRHVGLNTSLLAANNLTFSYLYCSSSQTTHTSRDKPQKQLLPWQAGQCFIDDVNFSQCFPLRGYMSEKSTFFLRTDTLFVDLWASRPSGGKANKIKTNKHLTLSYKHYLQNRHTSP